MNVNVDVDVDVDVNVCYDGQQITRDVSATVVWGWGGTVQFRKTGHKCPVSTLWGCIGVNPCRETASGESDRVAPENIAKIIYVPQCNFSQNLGSNLALTSNRIVYPPPVKCDTFPE